MDDLETLYPGQPSTLDPKYSLPTSPNPNLPYTTFNQLSTSMDARTADQVKEASKNLNTGLKSFEVAGHSAEVFDAMPNDQLKEVQRVSKLVGANASLHAPMVDPTGIGQQGWEEHAQKSAERQLWSAVEKSHDLRTKDNPNVIVNFHASTIGAPMPEQKQKINGKEKTESVWLIDSKGKGFKTIKADKKYFDEEQGLQPKGIKFNPEAEIKKINSEAWNDTLRQTAYYLDIGRDRLNAIKGEDLEEYQELAKTNPPEGVDFQAVQELGKKAKRAAHGDIYLKDSFKQMKELLNLAWEDANKEQKEQLDKWTKQVTPYAQKLNNNELKEVNKFADILEDGVDLLKNIKPKLFVPLRDFAAEKSAETVSNIAMRSYKKFKNEAPIIAVENHPAGTSILTTGDDIKDVVVKARKNFVENASKSKDQGGLGLSKGQAKKQAEKLIGATWDVGHINMLRKYGYDKQDIIKQTEKVAPYVKHVHLSDNFGYEHTELPMGMGNVPIKQIMSKLGKEGFKGKQVAEALSWGQHFSNQGQIHAIQPTLQGFNSPIYGMQNAPYWNQAIGLQGGYQGFPHSYLPEKHFSTYGTSFSSLPQELGGQMPGTNSRFSGTPNT